MGRRRTFVVFARIDGLIGALRIRRSSRLRENSGRKAQPGHQRNNGTQKSMAHFEPPSSFAKRTIQDAYFLRCPRINKVWSTVSEYRPLENSQLRTALGRMKINGNLISSLH